MAVCCRVVGPPRIDVTPGHPTIRLEITPVFEFTGPSAGAAFVVALAALVTGCSVRTSVAVTGEISLDGGLTKVGSVAAKARAVKKLGINHLYVPAANLKDAMDSGVKLVGCMNIKAVLKSVFVKASTRAREDPTCDPASVLCCGS
jgi:ATP-dependent Lon protease